MRDINDDFANSDFDDPTNGPAVELTHLRVNPAEYQRELVRRVDDLQFAVELLVSHVLYMYRKSGGMDPEVSLELKAIANRMKP